MDTLNAMPEDVLSSGHTTSLWTDTVSPLKYESLSRNIETDVVIVGGGIAGLSVAYNLSKAGKKVVVVEDGYLGSGETGRTTAHITNALDDRYFEIQKIHGREVAQLAAESHTQAIGFIKETVATENIDCDFCELDGHLFLHPSDTRKTIDDEFSATREVLLTTSLSEETVTGMASQAGPFLTFKNQAQFHPLRYMKGLAEAIIKYGGEIYTSTRATEINKNGVQTKDFEIKANHVVVTTNTPVNDMVTMHTKQYPYRSYVIAVMIPKNSLKPALWWDTGDHDSKWITMPYHYVRMYQYNDQNDLLIVGGQDHKTGQADAEDLPEQDRYEALSSWAKERFPMMGEEIYRWSGQVMEPIDALAFIGRNPGDKNIYIATGDSGNGITHGTIAGLLITDLIVEKENKWEKLYDPSRLMLHSLGDYLHEAGNMAAQYIDFFKGENVSAIDELATSQGVVISEGLKKVAVFKNTNGTLNTFSAICPHLGCVLQWNGSEKSFDCPCHGSRFTHEGKLINGPANTDLKKIVLKRTTDTDGS